jgi:hypothetical protein
MINIKTVTVEKFLSNKEIELIENIMKTTEIEVNNSGKEHGNHMADYFYVKLYNHQPHKEIADLLIPRIKNLLHADVYIDDCHIMESFIPYIPHSDLLTPVPPDGYREAWTIIIPLDDYNSSTFIFEEECPWTKSVIEWAKTDKIIPKNAISDHMYNTYFTHSDKEQYKYLTIHDIFPWRKGWLNATSRARFHTSDNYKGKGLQGKRGIVMWTSLPISSENKR